MAYRAKMCAEPGRYSFHSVSIFSRCSNALRQLTSDVWLPSKCCLVGSISCLNCDISSWCRSLIVPIVGPCLGHVSFSTWLNVPGTYHPVQSSINFTEVGLAWVEVWSPEDGHACSCPHGSNVQGISSKRRRKDFSVIH